MTNEYLLEVLDLYVSIGEKEILKGGKRSMVSRLFDAYILFSLP